MAADATSLKLVECFLSLQGESRSVGLPTVFVRLSGCPLRCRYCDTEWAFRGGETMTIDALLEQVSAFGVARVCVTGGEPLAQRGAPELLSRLCDLGYEVSLETGGMLDIGAVDRRVSRVVDLKTPGSGEVEANRWENLALIGSNDQLKWVICDRNDYEWARNVVQTRDLTGRCELLFSPAWGQCDARDLAEWILEDRLDVRLQLQLHKLLWGEERGR